MDEVVFLDDNGCSREGLLTGEKKGQERWGKKLKFWKGDEERERRMLKAGLSHQPVVKTKPKGGKGKIGVPEQRRDAKLWRSRQGLLKKTRGERDQRIESRYSGREVEGETSLQREAARGEKISKK